MDNLIALDFVDYEILALIVNRYLREERQRWKYLDGLYSERFYLEGQLAVLLHKQGRLSEDDLKKSWTQIDARAAIYDDRCLNRFIISDYLQNLTHRLRSLARQAKEEARHAA